MDKRVERTTNGSRFAADRYPSQRLTGLIIASAHYVFRQLGYGFLESVYRRALVVELRYRGVPVAEEVRFEILHRGVSVGVYRADVVAESCVLVETKTGTVLDPRALVQLHNYLLAARLSLGLVIHFGPKGVTAKRVIV